MKSTKIPLLAATGGIVAVGAISLLKAALVALPSGVVGLLAFARLGEACVDWYQISSREGQSGYFIAGVALAGGGVGLAAGAVCGLKWGHSAGGFFKALSIAVAIVMVLALGIAGLCRWRADIAPTIAGQTLALEVEVRLPAGATDHFKRSISSLNLTCIDNQTVRRSDAGILRIEQAREAEGRWIVAGEVPLLGDRGKRVLDLQIGNQYAQNFLLPLPAHPDEDFERWSEWLPKGTASEPWPDSKLSYRFRLRRIP